MIKIYFVMSHYYMLLLSSVFLFFFFLLFHQGRQSTGSKKGRQAGMVVVGQAGIEGKKKREEKAVQKAWQDNGGRHAEAGRCVWARCGAGREAEAWW